MKFILLLSILYQISLIQGQDLGQCSSEKEFEEGDRDCTATGGGSSCMAVCDTKECCLKATIESNGVESFILMCIGMGSDDADSTCKEAIINCEAGTNICMIGCDAKAGCEQSTINAAAAVSLTLTCGDSFDDSCKAATVTCPSSQAQGTCTITCDDGACDDLTVTNGDACVCTGAGCSDVSGCDGPLPDTSDMMSTTQMGSTSIESTSMESTSMESTSMESTTMESTSMETSTTDPDEADPTNVGAEGSRFDCMGEQECKEDQKVCVPDDDCMAHCIGKSACEQAMIDSNDAPSLTVVCTSTEDDDSACKKIMVICTNGTDCSLICVGKSGCEQADVDASDAVSLTVTCNEAEDVCKSGVFRCPESVNATCTITCPPDSCEDLVIFDPSGILMCSGGGCPDAVQAQEEEAEEAQEEGEEAQEEAEEASEQEEEEEDEEDQEEEEEESEESPESTESTEESEESEESSEEESPESTEESEEPSEEESEESEESEEETGTNAANAVGNDGKIIQFEHNEESDYNDNGVDEKNITLSLSQNSTIHLWGMIAVILLCNIGLYICYHNKFKNRTENGTRTEKNYIE